jgi:adenine-specific DNA-methyltransferase
VSRPHFRSFKTTRSDDSDAQKSEEDNRQLSLPLSDRRTRFGGVTDLAFAPAPNRQKELGAFYTPPAMAQILADWAIREPGDRVLDPSFGGLVFMRASQARLSELGASVEGSAGQIFGVDVDATASERAAADAGPNLDAANFLSQDFFSVETTQLPPMDAVVGNPPYIRYQSFNGHAVRARELSFAAGVKLSKLASSWAPFLVHATSFLAPGGRLAQVLPAELLHAQYARPVIDFLRREFAEITVVVFDERVFPGASEDVILLFADGRGTPGVGELRVSSCATIADLAASLGAPDYEHLLSGEPVDDHGGLLGQLLPSDTLALYRRLGGHRDVQSLGDFASVDIGIVTGANKFFLLAASEAEELDDRLLQPAIGKAAQLAGARFAPKDHRDLLAAGRPGLMFAASREQPRRVLRTAARHISRGEEEGFHERYKCRIRDPWWELPLPSEGPPDLLLTYCSNEHPRIALNEAAVISTNTLHGVRVSDPALAPRLAAGFYNSLTLLSAEIVGRSYGGGVLKLEPTEAERLLLPPLPQGLGNELSLVDGAIRSRDIDAALAQMDELTLKPLGLSDGEIGALRDGRDLLRSRRASRSRAAR